MTESVHAPDVTSREGRGYSVSSFVLAVLAVTVMPPLHGIIGAVLGYVGWKKGDPLGRTAMVCSLVAMMLGMVLATFLYRAAT